MKFVAALLFLFAAGCQPKVDPPLHITAEQNIWKMETLVSRCTAFQIDVELIATAAHCVNSSIYVFNNGLDVLSGTLVGKSETSDVALFYVPGAERVGFRVSKDVPRTGDSVIIGGFPARVSDKFVLFPINIVAVDGDSAGGKYAHSMGQAVWPGMSGGPVLNSDNEVVGVVSSVSQHIFGDPEDPNTLVREAGNYAIDIHNVIMEIINSANERLFDADQE